MEALRGLAFSSGVVEITDEAEAPGAPDAELAANELRLADAAYAEGRVVDCARHRARTVFYGPQWPTAYDALCEFLSRSGLPVEGAAAGRSALNLDSMRVSARHMLALCLYVSGDDVAAGREWQTVVEQQPDHAEALTRLAIVRYYEADYDAAWRHTVAAESLGTVVPAHFRDQLALRMPQP